MKENTSADEFAAYSENIFRTLIEESPSPVGLYVGREMVIRVVNNALLKIWGKGDHVVGKTYYEVLPELADQPFFKILDDVYTTGTAYEATEDLVRLVQDGELKDFYFNFTFKPLKTPQGKVWGVLNTATDITEIVLTRKQLQEAEARKHFALNAAEMGTWDLDLVNNIVTWDDRCKELFGFDRDAMVRYEDVLSSIHPDDAPRVDIAVMNAINPELHENYDVTYRTVGKNNIRWVRCKGRAYFDRDDLPYRFAGTVVDITPEIHNRDEQQKLLFLIENSTDSISLATWDGRYTYINNAGLRLMGFETQEQALADAYAGIMPYELERAENVILPTILKEGRWEGELAYRNVKTGEVIPAYITSLLLKDPMTERPVGRATIARDMRAELAAKTEQQKLITVVENSADLIGVTDTEGNVTYMNKAGMQMMGADTIDECRRKSEDYFMPGERRFLAEVVAKAVIEKGSWAGEMNYRHFKTGEAIPVWLNAFTLTDPTTHQLIGFASVTRDIRAEKAAQRQKDDFIGIASHELKTPVTSIKAYTQLLESIMRRKGDMREADMISKMEVQIDRLTMLIEDLLDVTKITSGRLQFHQSWFHLTPMMQDVVEDLQRTTTKHVLIEDFRADVQIYADKDRIGQVLINLITNAIKYSPNADEVIISSRLAGDHVEVYVKDFGIGIASDKIDKVFEQFYRVSGDKEHTFPGLGLGLYISSEIISREGGKIWVNSTEGKGSTFCFSLPLRQRA